MKKQQRLSMKLLWKWYAEFWQQKEIDNTSTSFMEFILKRSKSPLVEVKK